MVSICIYKNQEQYKGFCCSGHAGYADSGADIVCSAVSMLVINTINSIECFTDCRMNVESDEKTGYINVEFPEHIGKDVSLLMDAMALGITGAEKQYGSRFVKLEYKEG